MLWFLEAFMTTHGLTLRLVGSNPVRRRATLSYSLPRSSAVSLEMHDSLGECVRRLVDRTEEGGGHAVSFDLRDERARPLAAGNYLVRLEAEGEVRKLEIVVEEE